MEHYLQFFNEEKEGKYKGYKYPNLIEVQKQSCLYLGYFANVTEELVLAAFRGEEELTADEIWKVAHYNGIPLSVLTCPKIIMLDMKRVRHRKMVTEVNNLYIRLKCMAREGNQEAEKHLDWADRENQDFLRAVYNNKLSYIHYLGAKRQISDCILFSRPKPAKRTMKGGAV